MFNLNFKDSLKILLKQKTNTLIEEAVDTSSELVLTPQIDIQEEANIEKSGPLSTDQYLELIDLLKVNSKNKLKEQPSENLFTVKSVLTVLVFLITSILVQLDNALIDNKLSSTELVQLSIVLIGAVSTVAARGSEGNLGVFTPHYMSGLNKEDYEVLESNSETLD